MTATPDWLEKCLTAAAGARVAVFGDFCVDAYWLIDPDEGELSVETHLPVRRVRRQRYSLGGAGNVTANLADLGAAEVRAVGLVGNDPFGRLLTDMLERLGVDAEGMLDCQDDWQTMVFGKPCIGEVECNRIDFGGFNEISAESIDRLARQLDRAADRADAVILNQQVPLGVSAPETIERLNESIARRAEVSFIVDSRHRPELYRGGMLKLNAHEAAGLVGCPRPLDRPVARDEARDFAGRLFERTGRAVFVTRGAEGIIVADRPGLTEVPGVKVTGPVDTVGAGDTVAAALAAALAGGVDPPTAARFASLAAAVTIGKLQVTGTARPDEIRRAAAELLE